MPPPITWGKHAAFLREVGRMRQKCRRRSAGTNLPVLPGKAQKAAYMGGAAAVQGKNRIFFLFQPFCGWKKSARRERRCTQDFADDFISYFFYWYFFYTFHSGEGKGHFRGTGIPDLFFPFRVRVFHALFMHEK
ncbi:hypothetical protein [Mailhella massiliensis]|uniref:hypothetical protein n=1 Tax=Mailhella massiliensis TaxID=1903261 RepID=UPI002357E6E7|nr:hypothetical protein [Mailhella massiliensis]